MKKFLIVLALVQTVSLGMAGGEQISRPLTPAPRQPVSAQPAPMPGPRAIEPSAIRPVYRPGDEVTRNLPLPAPYRPGGHGKELNDFYGPTYYYPWTHNLYEGTNPKYYPFLPVQANANYKAPGIYCPGQLCGSSRSNWYWDSYDDWKRGGRYEQHQ